MEHNARNILGGRLEPCEGCEPYCCGASETGAVTGDVPGPVTATVTGFFRDGYCHTDELDQGSHTVCAVMSEEFLEFTRTRGNDLSTPRPEYQFPGLKAGDYWCLCALRWKEAYEAGVAPPIKPEATHERALDYIEKSALEKYYSNK